MNFNQAFKLHCPVQNFIWGKDPNSSLVYQIASKSNSELKRELPYAELWMGAHPKASAEILLGDKKQKLFEFISQYPTETLGSKLSEKFGKELPFLMKVLSINTALSIQAHPNKEKAKFLHAKDPKNYPDNNHKPEMGFALSITEILYGFRPASEIIENIKSNPELETLVSAEISKKTFVNFSESETIKTLYSAMMRADAKQVAKAQNALVLRLSQKSSLSQEEKWILRLAKDYPQGDVGIFSFYFLRYLVLNPGDAIYIPANVVHAYLSGDIVECMATSDNVIRAGITPKYKDVETLLEVLDYSSAKEFLLSPVVKEGRRAYQLPIDEFSLEVLETATSNNFKLKNQSPIILFCNKGEGSLKGKEFFQKISAGEIFFVPAIAANDLFVEVDNGQFFIASVS